MPDRDFWAEFYRALPGASPPWDLGRPSPPIARLVQEGVVPRGARVLVPGCGLGHDAQELARAGYDVTGMDLVPAAVELAREAAARAGVACAFEVGDFLAPAPGGAAYGALCEHTLFCAIDPERRGDYVTAAAARLAPGGVLFGVFYAHRREGGPPFATTEAEVRRLFEPAFAVERLRVAPDSIERRAGEELETVLRRR